jgi:two-component system response regulator HydG
MSRTPTATNSELPALLASAGRAAAPILAVVAGSGQVARYAKEAGADLLMALSAGFFRNLGTGSLASFMPFANTNELTERLLREQILPRRGRTPVIAGVFASDPTTTLQATLRRFAELGVEGITNWPAVGFADGQFREMLEEEGHGVAAELELLKAARAEGLAAFGFALEADTARRFTEAGVDAMILDLGLTRSLDDVVQHRDQLQEAIARLQQMLAAVRATGPSTGSGQGRQPLVLGFGGPVTTPEDFEQLLRQCELDGFAGGSVFERFPVQEVITSTVRRFKSVRLQAGAQPSETRLGEMIGASRAMKEVFRLIRQVAPHDVNVCIEGETGTGKELVASLLHRYSTRSHGPFITLNCGAIPESLLESELFGHEKGAFTGAHRQRLGKFELAHRGVLFLDEIADLSAHGQVALLRAIQQREITRVGGETAIPVDVRILTASHQSLAQLVQAGSFRADLFYRLNHMSIRTPPLRERKEDIALLSEAILERLKVQLNRTLVGLSERFLDKLSRHAWHGNVRELEHVLRRAALLEEGSILSGKFFTPQPFLARPVEQGVTPVKEVPKKVRSEMAKAALEQAHGNKSQAAARLGVSRKTFYAWLGEEG